MLLLDCIAPNEFTILANLIGVILGLDLNTDEQNSLGNFLITVGQAMVTVAAQAANIKSHQQEDTTMQQIDQLCKQIELLKQQMKNKS